MNILILDEAKLSRITYAEYENLKQIVDVLVHDRDTNDPLRRFEIVKNPREHGIIGFASPREVRAMLKEYEELQVPRVFG